MDKLCSEPNHTKLVLLTWRIPHLYLYSYFHLDPFAFVFMFVCLNYFLLSPEPIEAIFRPIHRKNRRPRVSLRYPPVSLKNNHLEYKHNYNHLEYKHNNAMNTNRTRMQLQMNIRWWSGSCQFIFRSYLTKMVCKVFNKDFGMYRSMWKEIPLPIFRHRCCPTSPKLQQCGPANIYHGQAFGSQVTVSIVIGL